MSPLQNFYHASNVQRLLQKNRHKFQRLQCKGMQAINSIHKIILRNCEVVVPKYSSLIDNMTFILINFFSFLLEFKRATMLFHASYANDCSAGTTTWAQIDQLDHQPRVSGPFFEIEGKSIMPSVTFEASKTNLYCCCSGKVKAISLFLTAMEECFYLYNQKKIYGIKIVRKNEVTILNTYDQANFINFYCHLAKYCVLRNFEKHFKVLKELGSGTFSHVYEGRNILSHESVALKVFNKDSMTEVESGVEIIRNEINNLEKLKQFHLSPLIEVFENADSVILVLKKAEAGNMLDFITKKADSYNKEIIKVIMWRLLQNLNQLHMAGFIHRDIKPENILFTSYSKDIELFLTDFGLTVEKAERLKDVVAKMHSGTLGFVAPEILHSGVYDEKCDIFSAGCLFYFICIGKSMFDDISTRELLKLSKNQSKINEKIDQIEVIGHRAKILMKKMMTVDVNLRVSASQALAESYFDHRDDFRSYAEEEDTTMRQYIMQRVDNYWK